MRELQVFDVILLDIIGESLKSLFHGTDRMDELNLSGCDIDNDCVEELLHSFDGLHTLKLANCCLVVVYMCTIL